MCVYDLFVIYVFVKQFTKKISVSDVVNLAIQA